MDWKKTYKNRLLTADAAVQKIKSGNRISISHAVGEPSYLVEAMVANRESYRDVEIVHMVSMGEAEYAHPGMEQYFRHNALFVGAKTRKTVQDGHGDFTPCYFSQIPNIWGRTLPLDVALIHVSPPDKHGYCSLGVSVDYSKHAAEQAKIVIAQVNTHMPRTLGDCFVHVSEIDYIVEYDQPLLTLNPPKISDVEKAIGENCASLVKDGDCLQLGIGAIPDAVLLFLKGKKDLGIHTEMFSDGVIELVEAGVINNSKKNFNKGKMVATFLMGTQKLYDFVDNNPMISMHPSTYTNDPYIAGQNDNLVSINSCVQVDLLGQVCSETVGMTQISAVGGQVDFVRAAGISKGGRSIIAMPSTAKGGTISKIVSVLDEGAAVTTSRYDVEYLVTEHGIANLKNRTVRDRARMLIQIAHPDFRADLIKQFEKRFNAKF
ncbi:MAG: 4-hydroxybutyrate CoA-transferase [Defluviitaleaceae bacterium]|nr:4-hydroxybutyrate CoA-transferase [Defluviitaleaceae bacterium]